MLVRSKLPEKAEMVVERKKTMAAESMSDSGYTMIAVSREEREYERGKYDLS